MHEPVDDEPAQDNHHRECGDEEEDAGEEECLQPGYEYLRGRAGHTEWCVVLICF